MTSRIGRLFAAGALVAAAIDPLRGVAQPALASLPEAMVASFADACLVDAPTLFDDVVATANAAGWVDAEPEVHAELRGMLDFVEPAIANLGEGAQIALFQRETAYRNAVLVVIRQPSASGVVIGCQIYDFDGTEPIPSLLLEALLGTPTEITDRPDRVIGQRWESPVAYPALIDVVSSFIPQGSPLVEVGGFSGTSLAARWASP
jgi:hypothetical protein